MFDAGRYPRAAAVVIVIALAALACGGNDSSGSSAPLPSGLPPIVVTLSGVPPGGALPAAGGCDRDGRSPAILWQGVPPGAKAIVLLAQDLDASNFVHWLVYDIPGDKTGFPAGISDANALDDGSLQGKNSFGKIGYGAPCPPRGSTHHYQFLVYALDAQLGLASGVTADQVAAAMNGHITAWGTMTVTFER